LPARARRRAGDGGGGQVRIPLATIVDVKALLKVVWVSLVAGVGVIAAFSAVVLGATRVGDMRRGERSGAAVLYGLLAAVGLLVGPFAVNPCQVTGLSGSSKRWLPSVTKQPLANMQWSPISTSPTEATITPMFKKQPSPITTRAGAGAVIHTSGSNSVCAPTS